MNDTDLVAAIPVLASLDIQRSVDFFASKLGFAIVYASQGEYGIVSKGPISFHFWACTDPAIPSATSCRIRVRNIESMYDHCSGQGIIHPNAPLHATPWNMEFAIVDPDGNLVTFFEPVGQ